MLTAFQQVEDQLAAIPICRVRRRCRVEAVKAAEQAVQIALNEYQAGTQDFTTVVTAETTALTDEELLLATREQRLLAAVSLIVALGGGWSTAELPAPAGAVTAGGFCLWIAPRSAVMASNAKSNLDRSRMKTHCQTTDPGLQSLQELQTYMSREPRTSKGFWLKLAKAGAPEATITKDETIETAVLPWLD